MSITVLSPCKIKLEDGRLLFSAVSHVGNQLILVGCHYFDRPIAYERVKYRVLPSTVMLSDLRHYIRVDYEPCIIITAQVGVGPIAVELQYEGQTWRISLARETRAPSSLSLMTLFKDDYRLLPTFISYYEKLGVDSFHLYFNGPLNRVDWSFLEEAARNSGIRVTLVEWDVPYWWNLSAVVNKPFYDQQGYQHHAQTMAMNHHLHTVRGQSDYTLFVDLDEYIFTPKPILDRCREAKLGFVLLQSWWATLPDVMPYESFSLLEDKELFVAESGEGRWRVKSLVDPKAVDLMGIHVPHRHTQVDYRFIDGFFHFYRFAENDRSPVTEKRMKPWLKSEFVKQRFSVGAAVELDGYAQ